MLAANLRASDNPNSTKCPLSVPSLNSPLKTAVQIKELENFVAEIKQRECGGWSQPLPFNFCERRVKRKKKKKKRIRLEVMNGKGKLYACLKH